jgi:hypothetical protein
MKWQNARFAADLGSVRFQARRNYAREPLAKFHSVVLRGEFVNPIFLASMYPDLVHVSNSQALLRL